MREDQPSAVKANNKLITEKEMRLIKHSFITNDMNFCGNLQDIIFDKKSLSYKEIEESTEMDLKAKTLLLHNKDILMKNVHQEWEPLSTIEKSLPGTKCQLCNGKNNVDYFIKNIHSGEILHIGSSCIEHFSDVYNIRKLKKEIELTNKIKQEHQRKVLFESFEYKHNVLNYHQYAMNQYENLEILLPQKLDDKLIKHLALMQFHKKSFISEGGDIDRKVESYLFNIDKFKEIYRDALEVVNNHRTMNLICYKEESDWLKVNNKTIRSEISSNDGFYTISTLKHVYNDHFIIKHLKEFNSRIKDSNLRIYDVKNCNMKISYLHKKAIHPITMSISSSFFMYNIGCNCLIDKNFKFDSKFFDEVKIDQTINNFYTLLNIMKSPMNNALLEIEIYDDVNLYYLKKLSQTQFSRNRTRSSISDVKYKQISYQSLISFCNDIIFAPIENQQAKFTSWAKAYTQRNEWITKNQKDTDISILRNAPTYSKAKEFV